MIEHVEVGPIDEFKKIYNQGHQTSATTSPRTEMKHTLYDLVNL
jgi:hypothetical protein